MFVWVRLVPLTASCIWGHCWGHRRKLLGASPLSAGKNLEPLMPLTDAACRNARPPTERAYERHTDALGLYLEVTSKGSKLWRWKYRYQGKEKRLAFGQYPGVTLADARRKRDAARQILTDGADPGEVKKEAKRVGLAATATSFEAIARLWWEDWRGAKSERYANYVLSRMEADAFPEIGHKPVNTLTAGDFVRLAKKVESRGVVELPRRIMETSGMVMRFAVRLEIAERNPVAELKIGELLKPRAVANFARVGAAELPELLRKIVAYDGSVYTRLAMQLLFLTFVRTSELICARWQEFDEQAAEWTIPADRVGRKGSVGKRRAHIVPLSRQALEVLGYLRAARGEVKGSMLLFPGERDHEKPMSNNTILKALARMGYKGKQTGHGFRGIASTALNEMGYRTDVIEAQLSHIEPDKTRGAYNHAKYLEERVELMQAWADYLDAVRQGGKVIPFRRARKLLAE